MTTRSWQATRMARAVLALTSLVIVTACASGGTGSAPSERRNRNFILQDEIRRASASNAFDLVQALRPQWFNVRGQHSLSDASQGIDVLIVYLDDARLGGAQALRQIPVQSVTSLQFLDAQAATYRWGNGHTHGAILVSTGSTR